MLGCIFYVVADQLTDDRQRRSTALESSEERGRVLERSKQRGRARGNGNKAAKMNMNKKAVRETSKTKTAFGRVVVIVVVVVLICCCFGCDSVSVGIRPG